MTTAIATTARSPKPLRLNQRAVLMPAAEFTWWHRIAIQTPGGLTRAEVAILDAIAGYYRLLHERGNALAPSIEEMAESAKVRPVDVTTAIKRLAGALATAGAEDGPPI